MKIFAIMLAAIVALPFAAAAGPSGANSFVRPQAQAATANPAPCDAVFPSELPIRCWTGQQLVLIPRRKNDGDFPYAWNDVAGGQIVHVPYAELVGKTLAVTGVQWFGDKSDGLHGWSIAFRVDETGQQYAMKAFSDPALSDPDKTTVDGVALLRDLKAAREKYLGKRYWILRRDLARLDENASGPVPFKALSPVTISDVLAGVSQFAPVRLVVKNEAGEEGYIDIAVSRSNGGGELENAIGDGAVAGYLSATDPKARYKFGPKVWQAIEAGRVFIGMTKEQATMSWGAPRSVNRTIVSGRVHEQWVYYTGYLYFDGNRLTAIQN